MWAYLDYKEEFVPMTTPNEVYVGIDVGKTWLDVALWGSDEVWRVSNDDAGVAKVMDVWRNGAAD